MIVKGVNLIHICARITNRVNTSGTGSKTIFGCGYVELFSFLKKSRKLKQVRKSSGNRYLSLEFCVVYNTVLIRVI